MMGDPRSHGLWEATSPPAPETPPLQEDATADVAVVGAGYTGLSTALHLAQGGASVVVLEAAAIGFGGSGRNVGLVNAGLWAMPDGITALLGRSRGNRLLDLLGAGPRAVFNLVARHGIPCQAEPRGTLHCAVGRQGLAELRQRAAQWQARGAPVRLLSASAAAAAIGSSAYTGALFDARAGTIQPLAYARGLARVALKAGARIHAGSPVHAARDEGAAWVLRTPRGSLRARWVVVATNAYTHGPWPMLRQELVHLPYFNIATPPLSPVLRKSILPDRQGAWDTRRILSSFRLDGEGRLIFGSVGALHGAGIAIHRAWARRALGRLFPALRRVPFMQEWYGQIGMTTNALPRLHVLGRNIVAIGGYNGRGIAPGTVFGACLADLVLGHVGLDALPLPVTDAVPVPYRQVREAWYEHGAQLAHWAGARF